MIKGYYANELPQQLGSAWEVCDDVYLKRDGGCPTLSVAMSQEVDGAQAKLALGRVHNQPMVEPLENGSEVGQVLRC